MHWDLDWKVDGGLPEKVMLLSLQGLANRNAPQLYVIHPPEYQWEITAPLFSFYERKHGVKFSELKNAEEALTRFSRAARGYVVWDPAVPATMNVAFTIAGGFALIMLLGRSVMEALYVAIALTFAQCVAG